MKGLSIEKHKVANHNARAVKYGCSGTLTIDEWIGILDYFDWKCAYCGGAYEVLEHMEPVDLAGTSGNNCVPACYSCNAIKSNRPFWQHDWPAYANKVIAWWNKNMHIKLYGNVDE